MSDQVVPRRRFLYSAVGFSLIGSTRLADAYVRKAAGPVLVQAGRRVDAPDAAAVRFPSSNVDLVRQRIRKYFGESKPDFLVTAAACGTDLLALEVAGQLSVQRVVLLPSEPKVFRGASVVDRPGDWGEMFDRLV